MALVNCRDQTFCHDFRQEHNMVDHNSDGSGHIVGVLMDGLLEFLVISKHPPAL